MAKARGVLSGHNRPKSLRWIGKREERGQTSEQSLISAGSWDEPLPWARSTPRNLLCLVSVKSPFRHIFPPSLQRCWDDVEGAVESIPIGWLPLNQRVPHTAVHSQLSLIKLLKSECVPYPSVLVCILAPHGRGSTSGCEPAGVDSRLILEPSFRPWA